MLKAGDVIIANFTENLFDKVTEGNEYTVTQVYQDLRGSLRFHIVNDEGKDVFPVSTSFTKKEDAQ